jgi:hypothetical protein
MPSRRLPSFSNLRQNVPLGTETRLFGLRWPRPTRNVPGVLLLETGTGSLPVNAPVFRTQSHIILGPYDGVQTGPG